MSPDIDEWLVSRGVPNELSKELVACINDEVTTYRFCSFYPSEEVIDLYEAFEHNYGLQLTSKWGFLTLGACPNGDLIVVDILDSGGSVCYLPHDQLFGAGADLRMIARRIAESPRKFIEFRRSRNQFPSDYYDDDKL